MAIFIFTLSYVFLKFFRLASGDNRTETNKDKHIHLQQVKLTWFSGRRFNASTSGAIK